MPATPDIAYIDTRALSGDPVPFTRAVINGLAPGGGLYVPTHIPELNPNQIVAMSHMTYAERAAAIYKIFGVDLSVDKVDGLMRDAYGEQWDTPEICPITSLDDNTHVLELWHGPTCAFKDMALQSLPRFFGASADRLRRKGLVKTKFLILVATSGDTGKAALEGFCDVPGVGIAVMYPHGGVSDIQYKQMATQRGENVRVWAVEGNFDDCQRAAKAVFADADFAERLRGDYKIALSSANSINWGRLMPQIVYYVSAYGQLVHAGKIEVGQPIDVCVPTGNFGNILAAWYARAMGTPIARLLCASNENRVLTDFINTGIYDISDREFVLTPSPSMDILVSSNLERQLFELSGRNAEAVKGWMADLAAKRRFEIDADTFAQFKATFAADFVDSGECLETIREIHDAHGYLVDPHTAVAMKVAERLRGENPVLIASTAHWAKFGENVWRALHGVKPGEALPADVAAMTGVELNGLIAREANAWFSDEALTKFAAEDAAKEAWLAEQAEAARAAEAAAKKPAGGAGAHDGSRRGEKFGTAGGANKFQFANLGMRDEIPADTRVHPTYVPKPLAELDDLPIRFSQVITSDVTCVEDEVCSFLDGVRL